MLNTNFGISKPLAPTIGFGHPNQISPQKQPLRTQSGVQLLGQMPQAQLKTPFSTARTIQSTIQSSIPKPQAGHPAVPTSTIVQTGVPTTGRQTSMIQQGIQSSTTVIQQPTRTQQQPTMVIQTSMPPMRQPQTVGQRGFAASSASSGPKTHSSRTGSTRTGSKGSETGQLPIDRIVTSDALAEGNVIVLCGARTKKKLYRVIRPLGKGSFGCVWQIRRLTEDAKEEEPDFALKEIRCNGDKAYKQAVFEVELMRQLGGSSGVYNGVSNVPVSRMRAPKCDDYEVRQVGRDEWRIRVVMSRLPGEPLDSWIERARVSERTSPREGRFWRDFAESSRLAYRLLQQLTPTFAKLEQRAFHRDVNSHNILISSKEFPSFGHMPDNDLGQRYACDDNDMDMHGARRVQLPVGSVDDDVNPEETSRPAPRTCSAYSQKGSRHNSNNKLGPRVQSWEGIQPEGSESSYGDVDECSSNGSEGALVGMDFWLIDFGLAVGARDWSGGSTSSAARPGAFSGAPAARRQSIQIWSDSQEGTWRTWDIGGDCKYWAPCSWKQFLYGYKYLASSKDDCYQYRMRLDYFALAITCLELLFNLCERHGSDQTSYKIVPGNEENPTAALAFDIIEVKKAWQNYWDEAKRIWEQLFATFKGKSGKDWQQLKQQFCRDNVSTVSANNVSRLKTTLRKVVENIQSLERQMAIQNASLKNGEYNPTSSSSTTASTTRAEHNWSYLGTFFYLIYDMISETGRLGWKDLEKILARGIIATECFSVERAPLHRSATLIEGETYNGPAAVMAQMSMHRRIHSVGNTQILRAPFFHSRARSDPKEL